MQWFVVILIASLFFAWVGLQAWRWSDNQHADRVWRDLARSAPASPALFTPAMVAALPDPARRYFLFTIAPGTPLHTVVEIRMGGAISLGTRENPNAMPMHARQILAPPQGLVWRLDAGRGVLRFAGSDGLAGGRSWTRFWLLNTVPVARAGGGPDHARAAFGRVVAEAVFWAPAALLPQNGVTWEASGDNVARATVGYRGLTQAVDLTVAADGRPVMVVISRWSDANPQKSYRLQPFGGYLSEFREFNGYTLATRVEGGHFIGTADYFAFYKASVESVRLIAGT